MDATRFIASVYRAEATLGGAISQMLDSDDQIICDRVREARETLRTVLEIARQEDGRAYSDAMNLACQEIGR